MNKRELAVWVVERHNVRHPNCDCKDAWEATSDGSPSVVILDDVIQQNDSQEQRRRLTPTAEGWFADIDEDKATPGFEWQPFLQTGSSCLPIEVWFSSKQNCLDWIKTHVLGQGLYDDSQTENNDG